MRLACRMLVRNLPVEMHVIPRIGQEKDKSLERWLENGCDLYPAAILLAAMPRRTFMSVDPRADKEQGDARLELYDAGWAQPGPQPPRGHAGKTEDEAEAGAVGKRGRRVAERARGDTENPLEESQAVVLARCRLSLPSVQRSRNRITPTAAGPLMWLSSG